MIACIKHHLSMGICGCPLRSSITDLRQYGLPQGRIFKPMGLIYLHGQELRRGRARKVHNVEGRRLYGGKI